MILKSGVDWPADIDPAIEKAKAIIDEVHREETGDEATCTSAFRPATPGGSSLHPKKRALDLRTWLFGDANTDTGKARVRKFAARLRERLGPDYDVIVEGPAAEKPKYLTYADGTKRNPHVHVEHDPR